ncbi:HAEPLYID family protein [Peijinzhouia sedimentorum]
MFLRVLLFGILLLCTSFVIFAQEVDSIKIENQALDSIYIQETEGKKESLKLLHAEPLYIDLIRDLGARKGEREWNLGMGITDNLAFDSYELLVEYEWAPIDRLGLEVELPFLLKAPQAGVLKEDVPSDRLESFKTAFQYTFLVSDKAKTSLAFGYINELVFTELRNFGKPLFEGNVYNPFFVAAKRWGGNYHTLIYTGPSFYREFETKLWEFSYEWHTNFHYMIPGTRNFIGLEVNKYLRDDQDFDMTLRPQIRVAIADNFLIGLVGGVPVARENERFSMFTRLIWEPLKHK